MLRNPILDIYKFIGAIIISLFHLGCIVSAKGIGVNGVPGGFLMVEMFFAICGFFIAKNASNYEREPVLPTVFNRLWSFYPEYIIAVILTVIISGHCNIYKIYDALLLLFPFKLCVNNMLDNSYWFFGVYILAFAFYVFALKTIKVEKLKYFLPFIIFILYYKMLHVAPGAFTISWTHEFDVYILPYTLARGIAGIGVGYLSFYLFSYLKNFNRIQKFILGMICAVPCVAAIFRYEFNFSFIVGLLVLIPLSMTINLPKKLEPVCKLLTPFTSLYLQIYIVHVIILNFALRHNEFLLFFNKYNILYIVIVLFFAFLLKSVGILKQKITFNKHCNFKRS